LLIIQSGIKHEW